MERIVVNVDTQQKKQRGLKEARGVKGAGQEKGQDEARATTCEAAPVPRTPQSPGVEPFDLSIAMKALGSRPTAGQVAILYGRQQHASRKIANVHLHSRKASDLPCRSADAFSLPDACPNGAHTAHIQSIGTTRRQTDDETSGTRDVQGGNSFGARTDRTHQRKSRTWCASFNSASHALQAPSLKLVYNLHADGTHGLGRKGSAKLGATTRREERKHGSMPVHDFLGRRGSPSRANPARPTPHGSGWVVLKNTEHQLDSRTATTDMLGEKEPNQFPQRAVFTPAGRLQHTRVAPSTLLTQQMYMDSANEGGADPYSVSPVNDSWGGHAWGTRPGGANIEAWSHINERYLNQMADDHWESAGAAEPSSAKIDENRFSHSLSDTGRWQAYSASSNAYLVVQGANTYSPEAKLARLKQRIAEKQAKNSPRLPDSASRQALSNDDLQWASNRLNAVERGAGGHQQIPDSSGRQSKQGAAASTQSEPLAFLSTPLPSCGQEEVNEASSSRSSLANAEIKIGVQADVERVGHPAADRVGAGTTDQHQEIYESLHAYEAAVYKRRLDEEMIQHQLSKLQQKQLEQMSSHAHEASPQLPSRPSTTMSASALVPTLRFARPQGEASAVSSSWQTLPGPPSTVSTTKNANSPQGCHSRTGRNTRATTGSRLVSSLLDTPSSPSSRALSGRAHSARQVRRPLLLGAEFLSKPRMAPASAEGRSRPKPLTWDDESKAKRSLPLSARPPDSLRGWEVRVTPQSSLDRIRRRPSRT